LKQFRHKYAPPARQNENNNTHPNALGRTSYQRTRRIEKKTNTNNTNSRAQRNRRTKLHSQNDWEKDYLPHSTYQGGSKKIPPGKGGLEAPFPAINILLVCIQKKAPTRDRERKSHGVLFVVQADKIHFLFKQIFG